MLVGTASRIIMLLASVAASAEAQAGQSATDEVIPSKVLGEIKLSVDPSADAELDPVSVRLREAAMAATGPRLIISLPERLLLWMEGPDTLRVAPIAIGKDARLEYQGQTWDFSTPRGVRGVLSKEANPVWTPPDWHYVELARDSGLVLIPVPRDSGVVLLDGTRVVVRGDRIGRVYADGRFEVIPAEEEVIFGDTLFMPPHGTANRRIEGELGAYKLDLGDGYMIHGTPHKTSIGTAATHGCIRVRDGDVEYLYHHVPVGTPVFIY